jgi:hypothetical protein
MLNPILNRIIIIMADLCVPVSRFQPLAATRRSDNAHGWRYYDKCNQCCGLRFRYESTTAAKVAEDNGMMAVIIAGM